MESTASGLAKFERAAESIRADIRHGVLRPGEKLPATDGIAQRYGVARATAQKAMQLLEDEGWVTKRASVGVFVNKPPAEAGSDVDRRFAEVHAAIANLAERVEGIEHRNAP